VAGALIYPKLRTARIGYAARMPLQYLFQTLVYAAPLTRTAPAALNRRLLRESLQLRHDDRAGRVWSARNYPGGYTSYNSRCRLQRVSPTFAQLERNIDRHVERFAKALDFDLRGKRLEMTDCWVNVMRHGVVHGLHLHPLSTISGTYYIQVPRASAGLKIEDPRLERFMAAPPRRARARAHNRAWVTLPARAGGVVLFESWLRHEVSPNPARGERVSVSFNYGWF
jgi:uncharacterized protein (TIGR02466 family)